jgi:metacaspase-1
MIPCARPLLMVTLVLLGLLATIPLGGCGAEAAASDPAANTTTAQPASRSPGKSKRALIVAISQYDPASSWKTIHSTNDIPLVQGALQAQGFQDIHVLRDSAAKAKGIQEAFQKYLIDPSRKGDIVVFHYSGHGQQITDDDGDEVDGYDEALVPYDAPMNPGPGYDGSRHLRDDVLNDLLQKLRDQVKAEDPDDHGNVVVFLDSCFSGTPRGEFFRGGAEPIGPPRPGHASEVRRKVGSGFFTARGEVVAEDAGLAPYVVFAAARADQVDQEIVDPSRNVLVGPLSWAVSRALTTLRGEPTYRNLFDEVQFHMREQLVPGEPQLEGDADTRIFSGQAVKQASFFPVAEVQNGGRAVLLPMGSMGGLMPKAEVEIHKQGTLTPSAASRLAVGKVKTATPFKSIVELNRRVAAAPLQKGRAFVTHYSFGDLRMRVQVRDLKDAALQARLRTALARVPSVELVESAPEVIVELENPMVRVRTQSGTDVLPPLPPETPNLDIRIADRMLDLARNRYLSRLKLDNPNLRYTLKIVPIKVSGCFDEERPKPGECTTVEDLDIRKLTSVGNQLQLPVGTYFKVRVTPGQRKAFGSLLDLMPDGRIALFWPPTGSEQFATNGPVDLDAYYKVTGPPGVEELLFVASKDPISFEAFETSPRGRSASRGNLGPFAPLFDDAKTKARADVTFSANDATLYSLRFTVVP